MKDDFIRRLEKLAEHLTKLNRAEAQERAKNYFGLLDEVQDLSDKGPLAEGLEGLICSLDPTAVDKFADDEIFLFRRRVSPSGIRKMLIQYFQARYPFDYQDWMLVANPDPLQPEMDNLYARQGIETGVDLRDCYERDRTLWDVFRMLGQLAHNVKSEFRRRVVRFLVRMDRIRGNGVWWVPADQAERLVDEFILCWQLVMKEASFVGAVEKPEIWPKRPVHKMERNCAFIDTSGLTVEEANEKSCETARKEYDECMADLLSKGRGEDPLDDLARHVRDLAKAIGKVKLSEPPALHSVDYAFLAHVLATETGFSYDSYGEGETENDDVQWLGTTDESTPEDNAKRAIVNDLSRYLEMACKLAKEVGSKSYDDLVRCQQIIQMRRGDFYDLDEYEKQLAARDLAIFITGLKRSAPILAADIENYVPPKPSAPKRKKKFQHEGNGLKGIKTKFQNKQLKKTLVYLKNKPIDTQQGKTLEARVRQCWARHPEWNKAVNATGENHGYSSYRILAKAVDNFLTQAKCAVK